MFYTVDHAFSIVPRKLFKHEATFTIKIYLVSERIVGEGGQFFNGALRVKKDVTKDLRQS